ncbi:MAG: 4-(cytidine 5'-diphospho)-2-C-methyl-D-erythritol kinase [Phycisphaerales bacterium]|nr:4-(cytidine 5'-diphospho)-2-C-methyl-D-erythritol kinase [Phycisphaerales bacterium]MCI0630428.1 4-(cytidine 5'-diphospho)-2-C-methyl-D-erythritol kinase [Phycisphaerales bacterium]MCI0676543.1 4-(cytidine 5'-diphospho)-2-C-methyl-D-erythritol kinase [Phycisphaerales bacterium]
MNHSITVQAPAKLNLALSVGKRRADGMHPICSWMVTVDLCDELVLKRLENGRLSRYAILWHGEAKRRSEINWSITKDLAVRAHLELEKEVGRALPVQMKLEKRIPVGGGLGGGSSDAAAMLRGANELFELGLSMDELAEVGARLGSDVPFLVHGGSAIVEGVGGRVTRHPTLPVVHAVVAFPMAWCPTALVYGLFDELGEGGLRAGKVSALAKGGPVAADAPFNDLAEAAIRAAPRLGDDLRALSDLAERPAHVSGSGSSIFVICDDEIHAGGLAAAVEKQLGLPAVSVKAVG